MATKEGMYHLKKKEEYEIRYELKIKLSNVNSKIKEARVRVMELEEGQVIYDIVYATETINIKSKLKTDSEIEFEKTVVVDYYPHQKNNQLIFQLFSGEGQKNSKHCGEFKLLSSKLFSEPGIVIKGDINDEKDNNKLSAKIEISYKELRNTYKLINLTPQIKDLVSKAKTYFKLYNQSTLIHVSDVNTEKSISASFWTIIMGLEIFNNGDMDRELKVEVYDDKHELIGITHFNANELVDKTSFPLINPNKVSKGTSYQSCGTFNIIQFTVEEKKKKSEFETERNN